MELTQKQQKCEFAYRKLDPTIKNKQISKWFSSRVLVKPTNILVLQTLKPSKRLSRGRPVPRLPRDMERACPETTFLKVSRFRCAPLLRSTFYLSFFININYIYYSSIINHFNVLCLHSLLFIIGSNGRSLFYSSFLMLILGTREGNPPRATAPRRSTSSTHTRHGH